MRIVRALWTLIIGSRETVILLLLAAIAAGLYAWAATQRAEVARWRAWAEKTCLAAGTAYSDEGKAGAACVDRIVKLVAFEREAVAKSNTVLADAARAQDEKTAATAALARTQSARRDAALAKMETANASIAPDDRVGPDWFDHLNDVAGLRPPD